MRKPLRVLKNQVVNVMLMVALTVPLLVVASTLENKPTLSFEGARIQVAQDGSVQLLFDVCLSQIDMSNGTQFTLSYNPDYLTPSNFTDNKALVWGGRGGKYTAPSKDAFRPAAGLYYGDADGDGVPGDESPFAAMDDKSHIVNWSNSTISVYLLLNNNLSVDTTKNSLISTVKIGDGTGDTMNVFNIPAGKKLVLGTISFRVTDPDLMPEITRRFDGLTNLLFETNHAKDVTGTATDADRLIYFSEKGTQDPGAGVWGIGVCEKRTNDYAHKTINDYDANGTVSSEAQAAFSYRFPPTIIKARAAEAELTLNAYQVYTDGTVSDVDTALQKYSPAITVTYSDGSEGNFIMPWNRSANAMDSNGAPIVEDAAGNLISNLPWTATVVHDQNAADPKPVVVDGTAAAGQITYDPTASRYVTGTTKANQLYLVEKGFCYEEEDYDHVVRRKTFPIPIEVKLTVTPVTLVDITASDLERTYLLNDGLVDEVNAPDRAVQNLSALRLPGQARLVTDVPVGGGTLTMDIPGWSHPQPHSDGSEHYWPDNTTVASAGIGNLWKDGADETTSVNHHWPTVEDIQNTDKWMTAETTGGVSALRGTNRAGEYTFKMAESYGGQPTNFKRPAIQALYPWLTVPDNNEVVIDGNVDEEAWPIDDAKRIIVWNEDPNKPDEPKQVATQNYRVEYISTVTDDTNSQPTLTLQVTKVDDGGQAVHLPDQSEFRIKLPDGTELGIGALTGVTLDDWFTGNDGSYQKDDVRLNDTVRHLAFDLVTNTGDPGKGTHGTEREALRRYINLGGWFSVAVKEKGDIVEVDGAGNETRRTPAPTTAWSDFIPVYVPPRDNYYTESKEYNFIGDNAGLYPWSGGLATTVILPPGTYNPVKINAGGTAIEPVYEPTGSTTRKVERYGVSTTYNGETGAQPGELHTFTIDPAPEPSPSDDWQKSGPVRIDGHNVTTYGEEYFKNNALYAVYGRVLNLMQAGDPESYDGNRAHTATVRLEEDKIITPTEEEKLVLEYVSTNGGAPSYNTAGGNVTEIIFEPRTQGYTLRQDYTLVLRNKGTVDIDGINLDTLTDLKGNAVYDKDLDSNPAGGHFEILKPPASFLPAGESTTFVISYVYDLRSKSSDTMEYRDKIFITSNRKDKVPTGDTTLGADYLLDFDAEFQVTNTNIHRVFVNVIPAEKNGVPYPMGTAGVIIGPGTGGTGMNKNAGPTAYVKGKDVYILISPDDEYTKVSVTGVDASGAPVGSLAPAASYENDQLDADGELVYHFEMPDYDTVITVVFNEPVSSKLRLSDLRVYASPDKANHYPHTDTTGAGSRAEWDGSKATIQRRIWQKEFDGVENTNVATKDLSEEARLRLMIGGKAAKPDFEDKVPQYLVVLPYDAEISQVEIDLREVKYIFNDPNDPIQNVSLEDITVQMTLFDTDDVNRMQNTTDTAHNHDIYPVSYEGNPYAGYSLGKTNGPTTHTSIPFDSPEPGTSKYVRVTLSYRDTSGGTGITESRSYYIELHRDTEHVVATLNYGNSPYGMIMNDGAITDKDGAKTTFLNNNYTFNGMAASLTPSVVTAGDLTELHYWLETWTAPTETWTPPNADWTSVPPDAISVFDPETAMSEALYKQLRKETPYENDNTNLDLNDYAFFAIMGEEFLDPGIKSATDSSGRPVDLSKAVLSLEAYTLDNTTVGIDKDAPLGQLDRFALPSDPDDLKTRTVTIDFLNAADTTKAAVSGDKVTADWAKWYRTPTGELTREAGDDNTLVELRPGRYRLTYTFPNYNDYTAPSTSLPEDPAAPKDVEDHLTFTRDFVVLAPVGDVNADISVTTGTTQSDEALLEGRISPNAGYPALGYMSYDADAIFKLRTCDVNNDRNINNIDANTIGKKTAVQRFYLPVDYKPTSP